MERSQSRRWFLAGTSVIVGTSLAGCLGGDDDGDEKNDDEADVTYDTTETTSGGSNYDGPIELDTQTTEFFVGKTVGKVLADVEVTDDIEAVEYVLATLKRIARTTWTG